MKYYNVAISGGIGVGTSTLLKNLRFYLEPLGWRLRSTGQLVREYTKENVLPLATLVSEDFDKNIEKEVESIFKTSKKNVIEGWLAGFVARDIKNTLKVLLVCSDFSLRVDRVANRDRLSIEKAKEYIKKREEENIKKWRRIYGDFDFFSTKYFDLVIDTYSSGQMETVGRVLDKLGYKMSVM